MSVGMAGFLWRRVVRWSANDLTTGFERGLFSHYRMQVQPGLNRALNPSEGIVLRGLTLEQEINSVLTSGHQLIV
jgi:hypothetical protein